ncbi:heterokaryon incompatibility protein-domain-containing protein [Nemania abortiva]|nr:heterokaryon incompatibility protein-domain-containing protein [Nemania abortiva]
MPDVIRYYSKLVTYSAPLPFSFRGCRLSAGFWFRWTAEFTQERHISYGYTLFVYQPLPSRRHIRLLKLYPGHGNQPLRGTLCSVSIDPPPEFEALSYVWGRSRPISTIKIGDDASLPLPENLMGALFSLRDEHREKTLWVDYLCINQQDTAERSEQIQLMGDIYLLSTSVIVWLGMPTPNSQLGIELLTYLARGGRIDDNAPWNRERDSAVKIALDDILARPYFERVWVVQETALAKRVVFCVGDSLRFEWSVAAEGRRFLARIKLAELSPLWQRSSLRDINFRPLRELLEQQLALQARHHGTIEVPSLLDVAHSVRHRKTIDPRDQIYGVMGLVTPAQVAGFVPDYSTSWEETYQRFYDFVERKVRETPEARLEDILTVQPE